MHYFTRAEIATLERLRGHFLQAQPGADYWRSPAELALYDRTFGARIGWKWDAVLSELELRGWRPPGGRLVDWGCGSGIAARRVLAMWPGHFQSLTLFDRSPLALRHARAAAEAAAPGLAVSLLEPHRSLAGSVVLLSHVLNELEAGALRRLLPRLAEAEAIVWVEAGTHADSRRLIAEVREPLLAGGAFQPAGPCTHAARCGLLTPANERHWCHSFGRAPSEAFQDATWAELAAALGIDLRSLPFSFLALGRAAAVSPGPAGAARVLGHPREYKGYVKVLSCQAQGVEELMLQKRDAPELYRRVREEDSVPVYAWQRQGAKIVEGQPAVAAAGQAILP